MNLKKVIALSAFVVVVGAVIVHCGSSSTTTTNTYASTSTKGDFAQWTIAGSNLDATWEETDTNGAVTKVLTVAATCGAPDATYGYSTCTVSSASCADGTLTCGANDAPAAASTFQMFEVPGTALFVHVADGSGNDQLHVGFKLDTSCSGPAGDYTFLHVGNFQTDLFGIYRITDGFATVAHASFDAISAGACTNSTNTGSCTANDQELKYSEGNGSGTGVETVSANSCTNGVRTLSLSSAGIVRVMQTASGVFVVDLPSGNGGIVAFNSTNAAAVSDFASKNLGGIVFPDNGGPKLMAVTTGAVASSSVPINSITFSDGSSTGMTNPVIKAAGGTAGMTTTSPAFPDFTAAPQGTYTNNTTLQPTYPHPSSIPGLFIVDGTYSDAGRVMIMATKYNGKLLGFGAVYNWRQQNGTTYTRGTGYYNSGAFILFEK